LVDYLLGYLTAGLAEECLAGEERIQLDVKVDVHLISKNYKKWFLLLSSFSHS
jgi:hypothetical protein